MAIVLIGTGLIAIAPSGDKAGRADRTATPAQDVNVMPRQEDASGDAKLQNASFSGNAPAPEDRGD